MENIDACPRMCGVCNWMKPELSINESFFFLVIYGVRLVAAKWIVVAVVVTAVANSRTSILKQTQ